MKIKLNMEQMWNIFDEYLKKEDKNIHDNCHFILDSEHGDFDVIEE